jgi:predicted MFS family arabinose efflux permease
VTARAVLATLSLTVTVSYGVLLYTFPVVLEPMERTLGLSRGQASAAVSIGLLVSALGAYPAGRWLDRRSPRQLLTFGSLLASAGLVAWAAVTSLWQLYAVFAVLGVAMALVLYPSAFAILAKLFWPSPQRALTTLTVVGGLAGVVFTPLAQWLVDGGHWRRALLVLAAVTLVATVVPHLAWIPGRLPGGRARSVPVTGDEEASESISTRAALGGGAFWSLTLALFLAAFIHLALLVHLIPYLTARGFSVAFAALAAALMGAMQLPGRALLFGVGRHISTGRLTTGVLAVETLSLLILVASPGRALVLVFVAVFGMARGLVVVLGASLVAEFYGPASYGSISGVMGLFTALAEGIAPGVVGLLHDALGGYSQIVWILAASAAAATVCAVVADRLSPPPRHQTA